MSAAQEAGGNSPASIQQNIEISRLIDQITEQVAARFEGELSRLRRENETLAAKVAEAKNQIPQYVPMQTPEDPAERRRRQFEQKMEAQLSTLYSDVTIHERNGVELSGERQLPVDYRGQLIPKNVPAEFRPKFVRGQRVRINPEAVREGFPAGMTWGDILTKERSNGIGFVKKRQALMKNGVWKYKVVVPGLTNRTEGDGVYEYELLPVV